jgi:hypothetical protein
MSKLNSLKSYLVSGNTATPKQIQKMFGIANPSAAIHALRSEGLCVYTNQTKLKNGTQTVKYRVGAPTKEMVQVAHMLGLFN